MNYKHRESQRIHLRNVFFGKATIHDKHQVMKWARGERNERNLNSMSLATTDEMMAVTAHFKKECISHQLDTVLQEHKIVYMASKDSRHRPIKTLYPIKSDKS